MWGVFTILFLAWKQILEICSGAIFPGGSEEFFVGPPTRTVAFGMATATLSSFPPSPLPTAWACLSGFLGSAAPVFGNVVIPRLPVVEAVGLAGSVLAIFLAVVLAQLFSFARLRCCIEARIELERRYHAFLRNKKAQRSRVWSKTRQQAAKALRIQRQIRTAGARRISKRAVEGFFAAWDNLKSSNASLRSKVSAFENAIAGLTSGLSEAQKLRSAAEKNFDSLKALANSRSDSITELETDLASALEMKTFAEAQTKILASSVESLESRVERLASDLERVRSQRLQAETRESDLKAGMALLRQELADTSRLSSLRQEDRDAKVRSLEAAEKNLCTAQDSLGAAQRQISNLNDAVFSLESELKSSFSNRDDVKVALDASVESERRLAAALADAQNAASQSHSKFQEEANENREQMNVLLERESGLKAQIVSLQEEHEAYKIEQDAMVGKLQEIYDGQIAQLLGRIDSLQEEHETFKAGGGARTEFLEDEYETDPFTGCVEHAQTVRESDEALAEWKELAELVPRPDAPTVHEQSRPEPVEESTPQAEQSKIVPEPDTLGQSEVGDDEEPDKEDTETVSNDEHVDDNEGTSAQDAEMVEGDSSYKNHRKRRQRGKRAGKAVQARKLKQQEGKSEKQLNNPDQDVTDPANTPEAAPKAAPEDSERVTHPAVPMAKEVQAEGSLQGSASVTASASDPPVPAENSSQSSTLASTLFANTRGFERSSDYLSSKWATPTPSYSPIGAAGPSTGPSIGQDSRRPQSRETRAEERKAALQRRIDANNNAAAAASGERAPQQSLPSLFAQPTAPSSPRTAGPSSGFSTRSHQAPRKSDPRREHIEKRQAHLKKLMAENSEAPDSNPLGTSKWA